MCRFLLHVLPDGLHGIRHYGLFAIGCRAAYVARIRSLLAPAPTASSGAEPEPSSDATPAAAACPCCGGRLVIIERFRWGETSLARPTALRVDTS